MGRREAERPSLPRGGTWEAGGAPAQDEKIARLERRGGEELETHVVRRAQDLLGDAFVSLMHPLALWALSALLSPGSVGLVETLPLALLLLGPVHFSRDREPETMSEAVEQGVSRALHPFAGIFMPFIVLALVIVVDFEVLGQIAWYPAGVLTLLLLICPAASVLILAVQALRLAVVNVRLGYMRGMRR